MNNKEIKYDICVIGGGHAGIEAVNVASKLVERVVLVTLDSRQIGAMSCNPAIGGLGKGHLVKEIAALGGLMPEIADNTGLQFRKLNLKKGYAVQGTRCQSDKIAYRDFALSSIKSLKNVDIISDEVIDFNISKDHLIDSILLKNSGLLKASKIVLCAGTFLRAKMFIGEKVILGGRIGEASADSLSSFFHNNSLETIRLKTGTPPRLKSDSIDWAGLETQHGDDPIPYFGFLERELTNKIDCHITYTNPATHKIIQENLSRSSLFGGHITGIGPRYCPSIEDKIVRFADKERHQLFLEPESLSNDSIYVNGISTSFPEEVQEAFVRSVKGLEKAEFLQHGYAVEYDYLSPHKHLNHHLQSKLISNLFCAGQVNGTSGYEEAASQGLVAGLNAALSFNGKELEMFSRFESYIGVLIDDLIKQDHREPYRVFTSRSENRLHLREDNAFDRLAPISIKHGLLSRELADRFQKYKSNQNKIITEMDKNIKHIDGVTWRQKFNQNNYEDSKAIEILLKIIDDKKAALQVLIQNRYEGYINRQSKAWRRVRRAEQLKIPEIVFDKQIPGISNEAYETLLKYRPTRLHQLFYLPGITPGCITVLHGFIETQK